MSVVGLELMTISGLSPTMPAGGKLFVQNVSVKRGALMLTPMCCKYLGGEVPRLSKNQEMVNNTSDAAKSSGSHICSLRSCPLNDTVDLC